MLKPRVLLTLALLSACIDPLGPAPTPPPTSTTSLPAPDPQPKGGMCGEQCSSAVGCGGSSLCRLCAGLPGSGKGSCLTAMPVNMVEIGGALPTGNSNGLDRNESVPGRDDQ